MANSDDKRRALVLRVTPWREHDLILDLLTPDAGRLAAVARGARNSRRRFGGALEVGTRVTVALARGRGSLPTLASCDVTGPINRIRDDLDRFHHLAYVLELGRLLSREGEADPRGFALLVGYIELLEAHPAALEALIAWELNLLAHHGYGLRLEACVLTGRRPDGISLRAGGAIDRRAAAPDDAQPVPPPVIATLAALARGEDARLGPVDHAGVRGVFERIWTDVCGQRLRSARLLAEGLGLPPV